MTKTNKTNEIGNPELDYLFDEVKDNTNHPDYERLMGNINIPTVNKIVNASLYGVTDGQFLFNFNSKDFIYVDKSKAENLFLQNVEVGQSTNLLITEIKEKPFTIKGSIARMYESKEREEMEDLEDEIVEGYVREITPAGYNLDITRGTATAQAFMPNTLAGINKLAEPEKIIGTTMTVMIESFSFEKGTYIVSRKRYLKTKMLQERSNLQILDKVYEGHVTGTTKYGVFVEFNGCLTGMIHQTNLSEDWRDRIEEIPVGTGIKFYVKDVSDSKIFLTQYNTRSVWDTGKVGDIYEADVLDVKTNGILVALDSETKGMVSANDALRTKQSIKNGDVIKVKITGITKENRKIFLTLV